MCHSVWCDHFYHYFTDLNTASEEWAFFVVCWEYSEEWTTTTPTSEVRLDRKGLRDRWSTRNHAIWDRTSSMAPKPQARSSSTSDVAAHWENSIHATTTPWNWVSRSKSCHSMAWFSTWDPTLKNCSGTDQNDPFSIGLVYCCWLEGDLQQGGWLVWMPREHLFTPSIP